MLRSTVAEDNNLIFTCNDSIGGCHSRDDMLHHTLTEAKDT